jgi:hypothetical protein
MAGMGLPKQWSRSRRTEWDFDCFSLFCYVFDRITNLAGSQRQIAPDLLARKATLIAGFLG